jgi:hypothetical protein
MHDASDVLTGWLWWGAGARWSLDYPFALEPRGGNDAPQMAILAPHFAKMPLF